MATGVRHGARFSDRIVDLLYRRVADECARQARPLLIVDPFAGTGEKIAGHPGFQQLRQAHRIEGFELEPSFISADWVTEGNALHLPYQDGEVDIVFTSPTYGNRFADHHAPKDLSTRHSYTFWARHNRGDLLNDPTSQLHPENTGRHHFGDRYQQLHQQAYVELRRVLRPGGLLLLNVSNFWAKHQEVDAVSWHRDALTATGIRVVEEVAVTTPRMRFGANRQRATAEMLLVARS